MQYKLSEVSSFNPTVIYPDASFTQADFYGYWQKKGAKMVKRYVFKENETVLAYVQLIAHSLLKNKKYWYASYGPVCHTDFFQKEALLEFKKQLINALPQKSVFIRLDFSPKISDISNISFFKAPLFSYRGAYFQPRAEWYLDITKSEKLLWDEMHHKARYGISIAERKGVTVRIVNTNLSAYADLFFELLEQTAKRDKFSLHSREYYKIVLESCDKEKNAFLSIAEYNSEVVSINLILCYGKTAMYLFGSTSDVSRDVSAGYINQWKSILYAKNLGLQYYNFGGISTKTFPNKQWQGITTFKTRFGGFVFEHSPFLDIIISPFWYSLYLIKKFINVLV